MKKFLLYTGLLSSMSFSLGVVFKTMHWPGANVIMSGGLLLFCCLFAPLWLNRRFKLQSQLGIDKARWTVGLISGVVFAVGNLFKVLHYPGANMMLAFGGITFAFFFLPMMFFRMYGTKQFG